MAASDERTPLLSPPQGDEERPVQVVAAEALADTLSQTNDIDTTSNDNPKDTPDAVEKGSVLTMFIYILVTLVVLTLIVLILVGYVKSSDKDFDLEGALKKALGGGLSGAAAMVLQVLTLMPLRTVMNYQYRWGTSTTVAIRTLYSEGGWSRLYQGMWPALIQGPVSRFGDTAANAGILALLESNAYMKTLPEAVKTIFASIAAALFRMILTPIDTIKTTLQAQGRGGMRILRLRVKEHGPGSLFWGAWATAAATFVGHYPWFAVYNTLSASLPVPVPGQPQYLLIKLSRQALIGFCSSIVSDTISNSIRVVKTYRQTNDVRISYVDAARKVIRTDGWRGLFGRGLKTRILANGAQSIMFSILWKLFMDIWDKKTQS